MSEMKHTHSDNESHSDSGVKSLVNSLRVTFVFLIILIAGLLIYFFTVRGFFQVDQREAVVVLRFGRYVDTYTDGWFWFVPYPVTRTIRIPTSPMTFEISFQPAKSLDNRQAEELTPGNDVYMLTGDANIIHSSWSITYRISDPERYFRTIYSAGDYSLINEERGISADWRGPFEFLADRFAQVLLEVTSQHLVDSILYGDAKSQYIGEMERRFQENIFNSNCGIEISNVILREVTVPSQTKTAFDELAAAANQNESMRSQAHKEALETVNEAEAKAREIRSQAEIYRYQIVSELKSRSFYFESIANEFKKNPAIASELYFATLKRAFGALDENFIMGTSTPTESKQLRLKINPEPRAKSAPAQE